MFLISTYKACTKSFVNASPYTHLQTHKLRLQVKDTYKPKVHFDKRKIPFDACK